MTSDAGALLLGATDRAIRPVERFAACAQDRRSADGVVHDVANLLGQRVFGIAPGYQDPNDHAELRREPVLAAALGRLAARPPRCAPLAGRSTLNRLALGRTEPTRYHRIGHGPAAIEDLFVTLWQAAGSTAHARSTAGAA